MGMGQLTFTETILDKMIGDKLLGIINEVFLSELLNTNTEKTQEISYLL